MSAIVRRCADSFEFMRGLGDGEVDVIITDPPYPEEVQNNLCSGSLVGTKNVPKYELPFGPLSADQRAWVGDALRIAKRWVLSFCAVEDFGLLRRDFGKQYVRGGIWGKPNAMGQLTADRPATCFEGVACLHRLSAKKRWNGRGSYGMWKCNGTRGKKDRHPNEKPLDLCLKLVALFSERGETVFDPFCGSAAIGEACLLLGRNYIGLDQDGEWVRKANARLLNTNYFLAKTDEEALKLCQMFERAAA